MFELMIVLRVMKPGCPEYAVFLGHPKEAGMIPDDIVNGPPVQM
jgi:hypothetical protein